MILIAHWREYSSLQFLHWPHGRVTGMSDHPRFPRRGDLTAGRTIAFYWPRAGHYIRIPPRMGVVLMFRLLVRDAVLLKSFFERFLLIF